MTNETGTKGWVQARLDLADEYLTSKDWEIIFKAGDLLADPDDVLKEASKKYGMYKYYSELCSVYKLKQAEVFRKIRERRVLQDVKHMLKVIIRNGMVDDIENLPDWMDYVVEDHDWRKKHVYNKESRRD
jgi:hypothetical protein